MAAWHAVNDPKLAIAVDVAIAINVNKLGLLMNATASQAALLAVAATE